MWSCIVGGRCYGRGVFGYGEEGEGQVLLRIGDDLVMTGVV